MIVCLVTTPLGIIISLLLSALINEKIKSYDFLRGAYFMPYIVSMVAVAVVWTWIYSPSPVGLLNRIVGSFGIKPKPWLGDPKLAMPALIALGVWKNLGYNLIILIAGLKSISKNLYEAASIDGADSKAQFRYITLPLLKPSIFFLTVTGTIYSFFQVFDIINVMTQGGPIGKTEVLVTYLYKVGFKQYEVGYASSIAFVLFVIIIIITVIQKLILEKRADY